MSTNPEEVVTTQPVLKPQTLRTNQEIQELNADTSDPSQVELLERKIAELKEKQQKAEREQNIETCCWVCDDVVDTECCFLGYVWNWLCRPIGLCCQGMGESTESCCDCCADCLNNSCENESCCCLEGFCTEGEGNSGESGDCNCDCLSGSNTNN